MDFSKDELDLLITGMTEYTHHLDALGRAVPALVHRGNVDELKGRTAVLVARFRREFAAQSQPKGPVPVQSIANE